MVTPADESPRKRKSSDERCMTELVDRSGCSLVLEGSGIDKVARRAKQLLQRNAEAVVNRRNSSPMDCDPDLLAFLMGLPDRSPPPLTCCYCDQHVTPRTANALLAHVCDRRGSRECPVCGAWHESRNLKQHLMMHTGERPFACPEPGCSRAFSRRYRLKVHRRIHTGERPYVCRKCGERFFLRYYLKRHYSRRHRDETISEDKEPVRVLPSSQDCSSSMVEGCSVVLGPEDFVVNPLQRSSFKIYRARWERRSRHWSSGLGT